MTLASIGQSIQELSLFTAVRESAHVYPILLSTHLAALAVFGGLILVTNLRLLGWVLADIPIDEVVGGLRRWKQLGLAIMVTAGVLLGASKAEEYLTNPFFQAKMALLLGLAIHGWYFRGRVYRSRGTPIPFHTARVAAVLSVILWLGVVSMGRWIAYYDPPTPSSRTQHPRQDRSREQREIADSHVRHGRGEPQVGARPAYQDRHEHDRDAQ